MKSPMRLCQNPAQFIEYFGDDGTAVSRELTKSLEENKRGTLQDAKDHFNEKSRKGEIVLWWLGNED